MGFPQLLQQILEQLPDLCNDRFILHRFLLFIIYIIIRVGSPSDLIVRKLAENERLAFLIS